MGPDRIWPCHSVTSFLEACSQGTPHIPEAVLNVSETLYILPILLTHCLKKTVWTLHQFPATSMYRGTARRPKTSGGNYTRGGLLHDRSRPIISVMSDTCVCSTAMTLWKGSLKPAASSQSDEQDLKMFHKNITYHSGINPLHTVKCKM